MTTANILSQLGSPGVSTGFKNRIINGAMVIDQRNAGASVSNSSTAFSCDRWKAYGTQNSKFTAQQLSSSPPAGFSNYIAVTSSAATSLGAGDIFKISQDIEGFNFSDLGWGTANAKTVTLSFWVQSSLTGTFGGSILAYYNGYPTYPFSYSIPVANTWTQISITIPGSTTGTWSGGNAGCVEVIFGLGVGSTYSGTAGSWQNTNYQSATGAVSVVGTNNATFYITGVQLEVGTTATNFDYRSYGTELALCQRYFQMYQDTNSTFGFGSGRQTSTTSARIWFTYPQLRTWPTLSYTGTIYVDVPSATGTISALNGSYLGLSSGFCDFTNVSTGATGYGCGLQIVGGASNYITLSAEL
jgi:hypothetical protein